MLTRIEGRKEEQNYLPLTQAGKGKEGYGMKGKKLQVKQNCKKSISIHQMDKSGTSHHRRIFLVNPGLIKSYADH